MRVDKTQEEKNKDVALSQAVKDERLARIVEIIDNAVVVVDKEGRIIFANASSEKVFGQRRENIIGRFYNSPAWKIAAIDGKSFPKDTLPFAQALATGTPVYGIEHAFEHPDGTQVIVSVNAIPCCDASPATEVVLSINDITERKRAEEALAAEHERLSVTLRSIGDGVISTDTKGNIVLLNEVAQELTGWTQEEAVGKPMIEVFNIINEETRKHAENPIEKVLTTGTIVGLANHTALIAKDGTERSIADSCAPIRDKDGNVIGAVLVFRDVTESKRAEEERMQLANRIRLLLESTDEGIYGLDAEGRCIFYNKAAAEMTGYSADEVLGKNIHDLIHHSHSDGSHYPIEECPVFQASKTGQGIRSDREVFWRKDRSSFPVEYSSYPIIENGIIKGAVGTFVDITERKRVEELSIALNDINAAISSTLDFDEIIQRIIVESAKAIGCETVGINVREGNYWKVKHLHGHMQELRGKRFTNEEAKATTLANRTKKLVVINDTYSDARVNPDVVKAYRMRSLMVVPLAVRKDVIGTLFFSNHSGAIPFSDAQVDFASKLSSLASLALENARLYAAEQNIADTLQEALLTVPQKIPGIDFGYLYRSATESAKVGGDFYDLFEIEHGKVGIVIGDVSGKGLEAATLTSLVKNTIRAYAYESDSPASIMAKTNELIKRASTDASFVSVFFGILDTTTGFMTYCSAGHPPAILKKKTSEVATLVTDSPVIGAFSGFIYTDNEAIIKKDDILILYTDGVIEARYNDDLFGEERLLSLLNELRLIKARMIPQIIFNEVMTHTGGKLSDDIGIISVAFENKEST